MDDSETCKPMYILRDLKDMIQLKLPEFDGTKIEPLHFFVKIRNYFDFYCIEDAKVRCQLLVQAFSGEALDLFLLVQEHVQNDLEKLESRFCQHFRPQRPVISEIQNLMSIRKSDTQTISEFILQIRKKCREIGIDSNFAKVAFIQGLDCDFQKHIAFQNAVSLEEM